MIIKSIFRFHSVLVLTLLLACGDDDEKKAYSFKDQDVKGKLFGDSWEYVDGRVNEGEGMLAVTLYPAHDEALCSGTVNTRTLVEFAVPGEVGLYKLKSDTNFPGLIVLFHDFDPDSGMPITLYVQKGAIEILTISETGVTGRMDARKDDNSHLNGNFTVMFCIDDSEPGNAKMY